MQQTNVQRKIISRIQHMVDNAIVRDRRFLDDEQLVRSEQMCVLDEIFNANVREAEIQELSSHFAEILRGGHPVHLAVWGKTGTGKTLTIRYFLNLFSELCATRGIRFQHKHLDLSTPRPCFRALNDLACLLNASKRYRKGISLEELMLRIESALARETGYLVLFIDEIDNVRRDRDAFLTFLVRRLPQRIGARLVLVFASNRLNWPEHIDPRAKSFLKLNELVFKPYHALDLRLILQIRVEKAFLHGTVADGVIEKIAALASRDHGDARRAVALLGKSAYVAEKAGCKITLNVVDEAATELDLDRYLALIRSAPRQLQAAMGGVIAATHKARHRAIGTGEAYDAYRGICRTSDLRPLTGRAFNDLIAELDIYSLVRSRVVSRGRYGRTREITLDLPAELAGRISTSIRQSLDMQDDAE